VREGDFGAEPDAVEISYIHLTSLFVSSLLFITVKIPLPSIIGPTYLPTFQLLSKLFDNTTNLISSFKSKNTFNYNYYNFILQFSTKERDTPADPLCPAGLITQHLLYPYFCQTEQLVKYQNQNHHLHSIAEISPRTLSKSFGNYPHFSASRYSFLFIPPIGTRPLQILKYYYDEYILHW